MFQEAKRVDFSYQSIIAKINIYFDLICNSTDSIIEIFHYIMPHNHQYTSLLKGKQSTHRKSNEIHYILILIIII